MSQICHRDQVTWQHPEVQVKIRGVTMSVEPSYSAHVVGTPVFTSDLSLSDQREQLLKLIADFSERLERFEDGVEKQIISARLVRLKQDLLHIQDTLSDSLKEKSAAV